MRALDTRAKSSVALLPKGDKPESVANNLRQPAAGFSL